MQSVVSVVELAGEALQTHSCSAGREAKWLCSQNRPMRGQTDLCSMADVAERLARVCIDDAVSWHSQAEDEVNFGS